MQAPDLPLYDVQTMRQALGGALGLFPVRVGAASVATFGLVALVLAIVGLYGVVSYLAGQREHEFGVRMAVGATRRDIARLVLANGLSLVGFGLLAGLMLTVLLSPVLKAFLFDVSPRDPVAFVGVGSILALVALAACSVPALRAARRDPTEVLRSE